MSAGPPSSDAAACTASVTSAATVTSAGMYGQARPPGPGERRSTATTPAPSASSRRTVASPMPEAPPVTSARRPAIRPAWSLAEPDATVHPDRLAGHVAGVAGRQPGDGAGDVGAGAVPAQRHAVPHQADLLLERGTSGRGARAQFLPVHLGGHVAWCDRVHPDLVRGKLERQRLGQQRDTGLGGAVASPAGYPLLAEDRAEIHDRAARALGG